MADNNITLGTLRTVVNDIDYDAFPTMVYTNAGEWMVIFRNSAGHEGTGELVKVTDDNDEWSSPSGKVTIVSATVDEDLRDPGICKLSNGNLVLVYNLAQASGGTTTHIPDSIFSRISSDNGVSWGTANQMTSGQFTNFDIAPGTVPIVMPNGDILCPISGQDNGNSNYSTKLMKSTDDGVVWSFVVTIGDGPTDSLSYGEPDICVEKNGAGAGVDRIHCFMREASLQTSIYHSQSDDDGVTWTAPAVAFQGTGNCRCVEYRGVIFVNYRSDIIGSEECVYRTSSDGCLTWSEEKLITPNAERTVYGSWIVRPSDDTLWLCYAEDTPSPADADVYFLQFEVSSTVLPLDQVGANAQVAYSVRLLRTAYTGDAIRVRRSSDDAEQDIGFVDGDLDVAALETFCAATDGFVHTWYDQTTNANDAVQATASAQMKIATAGVVEKSGGMGRAAAVSTNSQWYTLVTEFSLGAFTGHAVFNPDADITAATAAGYLWARDTSATPRAGLGFGTATGSMADETVWAINATGSSTLGYYVTDLGWTDQLKLTNWIQTGTASLIKRNGVDYATVNADQGGLNEAGNSLDNISRYGNHNAGTIGPVGRISESILWSVRVPDLDLTAVWENTEGFFELGLGINLSVISVPGLHAIESGV